jgi:P-type Na+/K+ transporter
MSDGSGIGEKVAEMGALSAAPTTRSLLTQQREDGQQI